MTRTTPLARHIATLFVAFAVGIGLIPLTAITHVGAATSALQLDIRFGGNFNVGNVYTAGSDETMSGSIDRRTGSEQLSTEGGKTSIVLGGGNQGLTFTPNGFTLGTGGISQGFVTEVKFIPQPGQDFMGTLFGLGGNFTVRYENGKLRTLFDALTNGSWSKHSVDAPAPSDNTEHTISLAYIPTANGTQLGSHIVVYLDGVQLSELKVPDKRPQVNPNAKPIGIGNDVHPAALNRGFKGKISAIRVATTNDPFDPSLFVLQQVSYVKTYLKTTFSGTITGNAYTAADGETVQGSLNIVNGSILDAGKLTLTGTGAAATYDAAAIGGISQSITAEVMVAPATLTSGGTLIDVLGAIQVEAAGANQVKIKFGAIEKTIDLGEPQSSFGITNHRITLLSKINEGGKGQISLVRNNAVLGEVIDVTSITKANDNVTFFSGVSGDAYGAGLATGGDVKTVILGDPCTTATLTPAHSFDLTPGECAASILNKASAIRPHPRQAAWQEAKLTAFLHYGINTFVAKEWSHGDEVVTNYNPSNLDTDQWARVLAENGFKYAVLTVKHHDGFVLYPSRYTDYGVKSAPQKDDVLRKLSTSLKKYGIKLGVYLSPADWSQYRKNIFANGSAKQTVTIPTLVANDDRTPTTTYEYQATDYGKYFLNQLYETLTEYGEVNEVWFDGADGGIPNASVEKYDFQAWYDLIRKLQPNATIAVTGPDVRWVGNEHGTARPDEWGPLPVSTDNRGAQQLVGPKDNSLGSNTGILAGADEGAQRITWWPAEVDVTMRTSGWFYQPGAAPKSLDALRNIYYESVARNSVLLLNVPPDRTGQLRSEDTNRLKEWTDSIRKDIPDDLALGKAVTVGGASVTGVTDGDMHTSASLGAKTGSMVIDLGGNQAIDAVVLGEDVREHGQQVTAFKVEIRTGADIWETVVDGQAIGYYKTYRFAAKTGDAIRVTVTGARGIPHFSGISAYKSSATAVAPQAKYYVDCSAPHAGNGRSEATPINSLGQLRDLTLTPGAEVSFKRDTTCNGELSLFGFGIGENSAQMTSYGTGAPVLFSDSGASDVIAKLPERGWEVLYTQTPPPPPGLIEVGFSGTFNGTELAYTKAEADQVNGTVSRRTTATTIEAGGAVIAGADEAIQAEVTALELGNTTLNTPLVLETKFTPTAEATSVPLATLFSVGGNFALRLQNNKLRLTMDSNASGSWKNAMAEAPLPALAKPHSVSLAYLPTDANGSLGVVYVDGVEVIRLVSTLRPSINTGALSEIGFGNEIHPDSQAKNRGLKGIYRAIRVDLPPPATTEFNSSLFAFQPVATSTALVSSATSYVQGSEPAITLTATVTSTKPVSGSVNFLKGTDVVATVNTVNGTASTTLAKDLPLGKNNYTAKFVPTDVFALLESQSTAATITVNAPPAPVTATVAYNVTIPSGSSWPTDVTVSGKATCSISGEKPWTATLVNGAASVELGGLTAGETCTFADNSINVTGWNWQPALSTTTPSVILTASNTVTFTGDLVPSHFDANVEVLALAAGGAPAKLSLTGSFTCSGDISVPFTAEVAAGESFATVNMPKALPNGATCSAALSELPVAPTGWRWVGTPASQDAGALVVAADRFVHFRISLTQESAPLSVQYSVTADSGIPAAMTFTGTATCDGLADQIWSATIPAGAKTVTIPIGTAPIGVSCGFTANSDPDAPAGWKWTSEMTSTDASSKPVTESRVAHFTGALARTNFSAAVNVLIGVADSSAPADIQVGGKFICSQSGSIPWSATIPKGQSAANVSLAGVLKPGEDCSSVVDSLSPAPDGWEWSGTPMSLNADKLVVSADRSVYYLASLVRRVANLSVSYQLTDPAPGPLSVSGDISCSGLPKSSWTLNIPAGQTAAASYVTTVPYGAECGFNAAAAPDAPTGWKWTIPLASVDSGVAPVTGNRVATYKGKLTRTAHSATVNMMLVGPAPADLKLSGKFLCKTKGSIPWSVNIAKDSAFGSTVLVDSLEPGDTCSAVADPLPNAPAKWQWVGQPISQNAGSLVVSTDRVVHYLAGLVKPTAALAVTYRLTVPAPSPISFTGKAVCSGLADLPWQLTISTGQTSATKNLGAVPQGTVCKYIADPVSAAPDGFAWTKPISSTDAMSGVVTDYRTATFTGELTKTPMTITRVYGATVEETAAKLAKLGNYPTGKTVYLSNAVDARDALAAGPAAGAQAVPLLLTQPGELSAPTATALKELAPTKIVLQGGKFAISPKVEAALKIAHPKAQVIRNSGSSALDTAVITSKNSFAKGSAKVAYLANAVNPSDALGGSAIAGRAKSPILLVNPTGKISAEVMAELTRLGVSEIKLLGGKFALAPELITQLTNAGFRAERISGPTAIDTALAVAKSAGTANQAFLVNETGNMEALATGPLAAKGNGVLLLNQQSCVQASIKEYLDTMDPKATYIVGSPKALAKPAFESLAVCR